MFYFERSVNFLQYIRLWLVARQVARLSHVTSTLILNPLAITFILRTYHSSMPVSIEGEFGVKIMVILLLLALLFQFVD